MWNANGKTTTSLTFLEKAFQKRRKVRDVSSGDKIIREGEGTEL
jgi:hypothetical protein